MTHLKTMLIAATSIAIISCNGNTGSDSTTDTDTTHMNTTSTTTSASTPHSQDNAATTGMDTSTMRTTADNNTAGTTGMSNDFVTKAADGGMMEVELAKIAQTNGSSAAVKDYGKMLETDHSKANAELMSIATGDNIAAPKTMSEMHAMHVKELQAKTGADFDKAYIKMMVEDHNKDIAEFKKASTSNDNAKVKAFAAKTLPVLQMHLTKAKAIQGKM